MRTWRTIFPVLFLPNKTYWSLVVCDKMEGTAQAVCSDCSVPDVTLTAGSLFVFCA